MKNVILFVFDSMRGDFFTKSKIFADLSKTNLYFKNCVCSAPTTFLSMTGIFTGSYPQKILSDTKYEMLSENTGTYIKQLNDLGYDTYCIVPKVVELRGLTKDFRHVESKNYIDIFLDDDFEHYLIERINKMRTSKPFFLYVHLMNLHNPLMLHKRFDSSEYGFNYYEKMLSQINYHFTNIVKELDDDLLVITADHGSDKADYDDDLDKANNQVVKTSDFTELDTKGKPVNMKQSVFNLQRLLSKGKQSFSNMEKKFKINKIKNLSVDGKTKRLLINSIMNYQTLYDEQVCVPLLFANSGISRIVDYQVRTIDVFPTIFSLLNLSFENIGGVNLLGIQNSLPARIETNIKERSSHTSNVIGLRTEKYKYIRDREDKNAHLELYNLLDDPNETKNIAEENPQLIAEFESTLQDFNLTVKNKPARDEKEVKELLKKLGYV